MRTKKVMALLLVVIMMSSSAIAFAGIVEERGFTSIRGNVVGMEELEEEKVLFLTVKDFSNNKEVTVKTDLDTIYLLDNEDIKEVDENTFVYAFLSEGMVEETPYAEIIVITKEENNVFIGRFNEELVDENNLLKINMSKDTRIEDQYGNTLILEDIYGSLVAVVYTASTKSTPVQTSPSKVIVLEKSYEELVEPTPTELTNPTEPVVISEWAIEGVAKAMDLELLQDLSILDKVKENITREEFTEIIMEIYYSLGGEAPMDEVVPFEDTENVRLSEANALGIVTGVGNNKFAPDKSITREEMAVILNRALDKLGVSIPTTLEFRVYADSNKISTWAEASVQLMNKLGIIQGMGNDEINPKGNTTIEQAIVMAVRFLDKISEHQIMDQEQAEPVEVMDYEELPEVEILDSTDELEVEESSETEIDGLEMEDSLPEITG